MNSDTESGSQDAAKYTVSYTFFRAYEKLRRGSICLHIPHRIQVLVDKHFLAPHRSTMEYVHDYFTDIFSWSVFPEPLLYDLEYLLLYECGITTVVDPCCGNGFHAFLFQTFTQLDAVASDIQVEEQGWVSMSALDARTAVQNIPHPAVTALLLSWIDYQDLGMELVRTFHGQVIICVGNYEQDSPDFLRLLHAHFFVLKRYILQVPWQRQEQVHVFVRRPR